MIIAARYSFNQVYEVIGKKYASELKEVEEAITSVRDSEFKIKQSKEKTKQGKLLYSPHKLNSAFKEYFVEHDWKSHRISCKSSADSYFVDGYQPVTTYERGYREIDFMKNRVGVEVQFGKYSFTTYDVFAKMPIFHNLDHIDVGIEIIPIKDLAAEMSSGVPVFEQLIWDLEQRGVSNIDIPVLVLGVMADKTVQPVEPVPPLLE